MSTYAQSSNENSGSQGSHLRALLQNASVEVSARASLDLQQLNAHFPGSDVHVTLLPGDDYAPTVAMAAQLRKAGFNPIPHVPARTIGGPEALDDYLARAVGEADVKRVLLIAGDVDSPRGSFTASIDVLKSGLLEKHGIRSISVAGHPEDHPKVATDIMDRALAEKVEYARANEFDLTIITQFCFDAAPVVSWLHTLRQRGIDAPVRVGVAGPANAVSLVKYGLRCGVGNSLRALRSQADRIGKLMGDVKPDDILAGVANNLSDGEMESVVGIHLYVFGGLKKTGAWYDGALGRSSG